jgi:hypothetical protein
MLTEPADKLSPDEEARLAALMADQAPPEKSA